VSGAHINPAVTLATVIAGILPIKMAIVYVVTQCLGAILGVGLLKVIQRALRRIFQLIGSLHQSFTHRRTKFTGSNDFQLIFETTFKFL